MNQNNKIKNFILNNLSGHEKDIVQAAIIKFGVSRQAIHRHMINLINENKIIAYGNTKGRHYKLIPIANYNRKINVNDIKNSRQFLEDYILPNIESLPKNIYEIFEYSVGSLLNNVIDHADASSLYFKVFINYDEAHFIITDNGVGLFEKICNGLELSNPQMAAMELAKGSLTTDPKNHSGDELNTIIHLFDRVTIDSAKMTVAYRNDSNHWEINHSAHQKGTRIHLKISPKSDRTCANVFYKIFHKEKKKIRIPISLLNMPGKKVVNSRLHANNILRNIDNYKKIEFDFNKIDLISPAFADELARKTKEKNQFADIAWMNTNKTVEMLMDRAFKR